MGWGTYEKSPSSFEKGKKIMGITVKKFVKGGTDGGDIHREIYQLREGESFFMKDPQKVIADNVFESIFGIPDVDVTKESIRSFVYGNPSLMTFHPGVIESDYSFRPCEVQVTLDGNEEIHTYENTLNLRKQQSGEVSIETNANFGEYKAVEKYVPFSIREEDVCYGVIGNTYRALNDGDTRTTAVMPPFDNKEDAISFYEKTKECIGNKFSHYDVEVFSKSHLEQVSWYLESIPTFEYYRKIAEKNGVFLKDGENDKEDLSEHDF